MGLAWPVAFALTGFIVPGSRLPRPWRLQCAHNDLSDPAPLPFARAREVYKASSTAGLGLAPGSSLAYFFLQDELGLSPDDMLRVLHTCDTVLSLNVERNLRPKVAMLAEELGLDMEALARCIGKAPRILTSSSASLRRMLAWLREVLGLRPSDVTRLVQMFPSALSYNIETLEWKLDYYAKELGLGPREMGRLIKAAPGIMGLNVEENVASKIAFFEDDLYLSRREIAVMVQRAPRLLSASLDARLEPTCNLIMEELDMDPAELARMVLKAPSLLLISATEKLEPFWDWLGGEAVEEARGPGATDLGLDAGLGCTDAQIKAVMKRNPSLCTRSLDTLGKKAAEIAAYLGLNRQELRTVIVWFPQVLSLDVMGRLAELEALLQDKLVVQSRQAFVDIVRTQPSLLGFKPASLAVKLEVLARAAADPEDDRDKAAGEDQLRRAGALVRRRPLLLSLGRERLETRSAALARYGRPIEILCTVGMLTEPKFRAWEARREAELRGEAPA